MWESTRERRAQSSRIESDFEAAYAVEQLEPKILLSAAPVDAPVEAFGESPLAAVDSSALSRELPCLP